MISPPRLLYDEPPSKRNNPRKKWSASVLHEEKEKEIYTREMYELHQLVEKSLKLPEDYWPPIIVRKVECFSNTCYRINIYSYSKVRHKINGNNINPGQYVYKSFFVEKTGDSFVFTPPLTSLEGVKV